MRKYINTRLSEIIRWTSTSTNRYRCLVYLSFTLIGLSSIFEKTNWIVFIALLPILFYIERIDKYTKKQILIDFFVGGMIVCLLSTLFLLQLEPENWTVQLDGWFGVVAMLSAWIIMAVFCGLCYVIIGLGIKYIPKSKPQFYRLTALPFLVIIAEIARSYMFAVISYGPGGSISPNFNWGSIAIPASGTQLVYSSRILGFFGISFLVVVMNIAIYLLIRKKILAPSIILVLVGLITYFGWRIGNTTNTKQLKVSAIHLNQASDLTLADESLWPPENTDILVFPEYSGLQKYDDYKQLLSRLSENGVAITTVVEGSSPDAHNRIVYLNKDAEIVEYQDKTFLIPTGEYVPYGLQIISKIFGKSQILQDFTYSQQLKRGLQEEETYQYKDGPIIGALACSGVIALNQYSQLSQSGADVLVNSASLSFLNQNSLYHTYGKNMARYQAVSNNTPFIQAMRSGQSYIVDNQGNILTGSTAQYDQTLNANLSIQPK